MSRMVLSRPRRAKAVSLSKVIDLRSLRIDVTEHREHR